MGDVAFCENLRLIGTLQQVEVVFRKKISIFVKDGGTIRHLETLHVKEGLFIKLEAQILHSGPLNGPLKIWDRKSLTSIKNQDFAGLQLLQNVVSQIRHCPPILIP
jgi:hypothetical protein